MKFLFGLALSLALSVFVDAVHGVRAAIEHEVLAAVCLLKAAGVAKRAGDVRRQAAGGTQNLDA